MLTVSLQISKQNEVIWTYLYKVTWEKMQELGRRGQIACNRRKMFFVFNFN